MTESFRLAESCSISREIFTAQPTTGAEATAAWGEVAARYLNLRRPRKGCPDWIETQLYVFKGGQDGALPTSGLVFDQSGNLYGVTAYGGTGSCTLGQDRVGCGTIFQMAPPKHVGGAWTEKIIYSFKGDKDGYHPAGDLIFDSAGKLYGSTTFGGILSNYCNEFYPGCGTVFELRPSHAKGGGWDERVIYTFQSGTDGAIAITTSTAQPILVATQAAEPEDWVAELFLG